MRLAAKSRRDVVNYAWLLVGGRAAAYVDEFDPDAWRDSWVAIFRQVGYMANGNPAARPERSGILYRGSKPVGRHGIAGTPDPAMAYFCAQCAGAPSAVYAHRAAPGELLAYNFIGTAGSGYEEIVLDPQYLNDGNVEMVDQL